MFVGGGVGFVMAELMVIVSEGLSSSMTSGWFWLVPLCAHAFSKVLRDFWRLDLSLGMAAAAFCSVCVGSF
jgi:hypothetical protein